MSVAYQRPDVNSFDDLAKATTYKSYVRVGSIQEIELFVSQQTK